MIGELGLKRTQVEMKSLRDKSQKIVRTIPGIWQILINIHYPYLLFYHIIIGGLSLPG